VSSVIKPHSVAVAATFPFLLKHTVARPVIEDEGLLLLLFVLLQPAAQLPGTPTTGDSE
jgi:hypothetical protein